MLYLNKEFLNYIELFKLNFNFFLFDSVKIEFEFVVNYIVEY